MPISTVMDESQIITGEKAKYQAEAKKRAETIGKNTTDRGTLITKSNSDMNKDSFLKMLAAELTHQDPTNDQDPTAYITQMAQFASMEQTYNLNETMTAYAYQDLIGKGVTMNESDLNGDLYTGIVKGVSKENGNWYLSIEVNENGKNAYKVIDASKLKSVLDVPDYTNSNMLVNSDFMAASSLAANENNKVVIITEDSDGNKVVIKGKVKSAYIDGGSVKVKVQTYDKDGNLSENTEDYLYASIYKAGNLSETDMNVKPEDFVETIDDSSDDSTLDPNSPSYNKETAMSRLASTTVDPVRNSSSENNSVKNDDSVKDDIKVLERIIASS